MQARSNNRPLTGTLDPSPRRPTSGLTVWKSIISSTYRLAWALLFVFPTVAMNAIGEAAMRNHRRYLLFAPVLALVVTLCAPTVKAGGVSMHLGSGGFGVSVGFGDWGVYTRSWSDPYWSIDFNATLSGYGQWVWVTGLGRVWRPWVAASWRPYTHGRWVSTGYGMTWVAYEPWGYVPHHYGSWAYASYGWVWVPGYSYSCANVVWVGSGGHIGWYARPPHGWSHSQHGFRHGYDHGFRDGYNNGYSDGWHDARYGTYVDWRHFGSDNVSRHAVTHRIASQNRIETRSTPPSRDEIRQRGGASITQTSLSRRLVRVDGREVTIARPEGVAPSIERNAEETVGRSLSEEARARRQPLVKPRSSSGTSAASSSRSVGASRDTRALQPQRSSRESTSSRDSGPSGATERYGSRRAPSESTSSRSSSTRQEAQPSRQTRDSQRSHALIQRDSANSRRAAPSGQRASESQRSPSRSERRPPAEKIQDTENEKREKRPQRRR